MNKKTYFERQKNRYKEGEFRWCTQTVLQQHKENCRQIMRIADEAVRLELRNFNILLIGLICPQMIRNLSIR